MVRQHQEMDRPGVRQVPEGNGEWRKMEETGCKIICSAPMTLAVKSVSQLVLKGPSTTKVHIRAEGDFHKEIVEGDFHKEIDS